MHLPRWSWAPWERRRRRALIARSVAAYRADQEAARERIRDIGRAAVPAMDQIRGARPNTSHDSPRVTRLGWMRTNRGGHA